MIGFYIVEILKQVQNDWFSMSFVTATFYIQTMIPYFDKMPKDKMVRLFRQACILEFITCILLYLIAMPIKYQFDIWWQMIPLGSLHGAAFTWYLLLLYYVREYMDWDDEDLVIAGMAAFFPFGTLWVEREMMKVKGDESPKD